MERLNQSGEVDIERLKRELAEVKKELRELYGRLTRRKSFRDPRITFPRPVGPTAELDEPID